MANEGSTKATYEELEAQVSQAANDLSRVKELTRILAEEHKLRQAAQNETERVRGLLQRSLSALEWAYEQSRNSPSSHQEFIREDSEHLAAVRAEFEPPLIIPIVEITREEVLEKYPTSAHSKSEPPQSSSLLSQGAESADIGKLDAVDEKADV